MDYVDGQVHMQLSKSRRLPLITESSFCMAGEIVYADLKTVSEPHASSPFHPTQQLNAPQNPRWQQIMLWVTCFGIVILLAIMIILVLQLDSEKRKTGDSSCPIKSNCSSDDFQSFLRNKLCNQSQGNSPVNSTCQICPPHWHHHQEKCYWPSKDLKSWNESQTDCSEKGAQLAVFQDKEEMEFLKKITEDAQRYWIGLFFSSLENKWVWITGHQYDQNLFHEPPSSTGGEKCGGVQNNKVIFDFCSAVYKWICQTDPILL